MEEKESHLPAFATRAMLESFARLTGMPGLLLGRRGLKSRCCGNIHRLLLEQPVYSPNPHKATDQETGHKKHRGQQEKTGFRRDRSLKRSECFELTQLPQDTAERAEGRQGERG